MEGEDVETAITFRQYARKVWEGKREEYGVTWAEAEEFWPEEALRPEWVKGLVKLARGDAEFPLPMVRTLSEEELYYVNKFGRCHATPLQRFAPSRRPWTWRRYLASPSVEE